MGTACDKREGDGRRASVGFVLKGWVWADREEMERQYAVPNAFRAFEHAVKEQLGYF